MASETRIQPASERPTDPAQAAADEAAARRIIAERNLRQWAMQEFLQSSRRHAQMLLGRNLDTDN